jgi:sugar lactone lactonase YvrE
VSTLAGGGITEGFADGTGSAARFSYPTSVAVDGSGNVYVSDNYNQRIRKITSAGVVTTLAGSGTATFADGIGSAASFKHPWGVAVDGSGNVYVADIQNNRIRKITSAGVVTTFAGSGTKTFADGTVSAASFNNPIGVAVDGSGNVYVADQTNHRIRIISFYRINPALPAGLFFDVQTGSISGTPSVAQAPKLYTVYAQNSLGASTTTITIGIADAPTVITTGATNVTATTATLSGTVNANGGATSALTIKYSTSQATVNAGNGTSATVSPTSATGNTVTAVSAAITGLTASTTYYYRVSATNTAGTTNATTLSFTTAAPRPNISYAGSPVVLSVGTAMSALVPVNSGGVLTPMQVITIAGSTAGFADGTGTSARFNAPRGLAYDGSGNLYVADSKNYRIRKIELSSGAVTTIAGSSVSGNNDGIGLAATFNSPNGMVIDGSGLLYVSDNSSNRVRKIRLSDGQVTTLAGGDQGFADGIGSAAKFRQPSGLTADGSGNLYVGDLYNHRIRKIETSTGVVTTIAGSGSGYQDGSGTTAKFNLVAGVTLDGAGNLCVADQSNARIRKIDLNASPVAVTTLAGSGTFGIFDGIGTDASFTQLLKFIKYDGIGNLYVSEENCIRKIRLSDGAVTPVAGAAILPPVGGGAPSFIPFLDGTGTSAKFYSPAGIEIDETGNMYVADMLNNRIRKISNYMISPALPAGLLFNTATGEVSGTPTALSASKTYTVTASNAGGTSTATFRLEVSATLLTNEASAISGSGATSGGNIDAIAYAGASQKGVCWNTTGTPTISNSKTQEGSGTGTFTSSLTGLTANTTY